MTRHTALLCLLAGPIVPPSSPAVDAPSRRRLVSHWRRVIDTDFDRYHMMRETGASAGGQRRRRTASALVSPPPFSHLAIRETVELCTISFHLELIARRVGDYQHLSIQDGILQSSDVSSQSVGNVGVPAVIVERVQGTAKRRAPRLGKCSRQGQAEVVSTIRNKFHQSWGPPFSQTLNNKTLIKPKITLLPRCFYSV